MRHLTSDSSQAMWSCRRFIGCRRYHVTEAKARSDKSTAIVVQAYTSMNVFLTPTPEADSLKGQTILCGHVGRIGRIRMIQTDHASDGMIDCSVDDADEQILLQRLVQGDRLVFWAIWELYQKELFIYCLRWMGGNREEAEDALSAASIKAWQHLPRYAQENINVKAWLLKLLHNHCIDMIRSFKRQNQLVHKIGILSQSSPARHLMVRESPEDVINREDVLQGIRHAIDDLPQNLQATAELRLVCGWSYNEIATQLKISPENARKRAQQARAILQTSLAEYRCSDTQDVTSFHVTASAA